VIESRLASARLAMQPLMNGPTFIPSPAAVRFLVIFVQRAADLPSLALEPIRSRDGLLDMAPADDCKGPTSGCGIHARAQQSQANAVAL
jgi:hypothetical protein